MEDFAGRVVIVTGAPQVGAGGVEEVMVVEIPCNSPSSGDAFRDRVPSRSPPRD
jgi:hypothetical protein